MKKVVAGLALVVLIGLAAQGSQIGIAFMPDTRAPSVEVFCDYTVVSEPVALSLHSSLAQWWYIGEPPTGYSDVFWVIDISPSLEIVFAPLILRLEGTLEYRTNLEGRMNFFPKVSMIYGW